MFDSYSLIKKTITKLSTRIHSLTVASALILTVLFSGRDAWGVNKISPGDYLKIIVIGYSQLDRQVKVESDGTILYPYLEDIPIAGMTSEELQTLILQILQKYLDNPIVLVEVLEKYSITLQVLGQVNSPGIIVIPASLDVQSAISMAGGFTQAADLSKVKVLRPIGNEPEQWKTLPADIYQFMRIGDLNTLPRLAEGDFIIVPSAGSDVYVSVIGEVMKPGNYIVFPDANILQAIMMTGGFTEDANMKKVRLIRNGETGEFQSTEYNLEKIIKKNQFEKLPPILPGDAIVVPESKPIFDLDVFSSIIRDIYILSAMFIIYKRLY